jgi:hypothetical protein
LRKTFTGFCTHNTIFLAFAFIAIDVWTGQEAFLFVDDILVWSKSISNPNVGDGGCGGSAGDSIEFINLMIPHRERQMTVEFRTSLANAGGPVEASWGLSFFAAGAHCRGRNVSACVRVLSDPGGDPLADILNLYPAYLMASAESWNPSQGRFMDLSGNGRVGTLQAGEVIVGSVTGNGAVRFSGVPYVGGNRGTRISWGEESIPSTFTICSITRYSGAWWGAKQRILQCKDRNWMHGHYGYYHNPWAGATCYGGPGELQYTITPDTNWVVACGRNIQTPGSAGTIINGVVTSTAEGGDGNCELTINLDQWGEELYWRSDWQLSKLYVWNTHLPDSLFAQASSGLVQYLNGVGDFSSVLSNNVVVEKENNVNPLFGNNPFSERSPWSTRRAVQDGKRSKSWGKKKRRQHSVKKRKKEETALGKKKRGDST